MRSVQLLTVRVALTSVRYLMLIFYISVHTRYISFSEQNLGHGENQCNSYFLFHLTV